MTLRHLLASRGANCVVLDGRFIDVHSPLKGDIMVALSEPVERRRNTLLRGLENFAH